MDTYSLSRPQRPPAWPRILTCLSLLFLVASPSLRAQTCCNLLDANSIFVQITEDYPGTSGFNLGVILEKLIFDERFDATGDGIPDLATIERNDNGSINSIEIVDVNSGEPYYRYELQNIFVQLLNEGWTPSAIIDLQVVGFFDWLAPNSTLAKALLLIGEGAPLVLGDGNTLGSVTDFYHDPPAAIRLLGLDDYDNDGVIDLLIGNKTDKVVFVASSEFAPGG